MKDIYKPRPKSVVDAITPLQGMAWDMENQAIAAKKAGSPDGARYYLNQAVGMRTQDIHERLTVLFERTDTQNAIIEVGLQINRQKMPLATATSSIFEQRDQGDER